MGEITQLDTLKASARSLVALLPEAIQSECGPLTTNALWNLSQEPGVRLEKWQAGMQLLAPLCQSVEEWRVVGQVQAWRHGLAWIREGALSRWLALRAQLQPLALGTSDPIDPLFLEDPWQRPNLIRGEWKLFLRPMGGFRGFGKQFLRPPRVVAHQKRLFAVDGEAWWAIHADVFGGTLRRVEAPQTPEDVFEKTGWSRSGSAIRVGFQGGVLQGEFPVLNQVSSVAATPHTLIATLSNSHRVFVAGRTPV